MSTTARRGAAVVAGSALALLGLSAGPAHAAAPRITFQAPLANQQVGSSGVTVTARLDMSGTLVDQVNFSIQQTGTDRAPLTASTAANGTASQTVSFPVNLAYNGTYQATVSATGKDGGLVDLNGPESATAQLSFAVAAPPARPTGVQVAVDTGARTVNLSWKANSEPDLLFYVVQRASGTSSDFTVLGKSNEPKFSDASTAGTGGTFRYQVVAVRSGVNSGEGINSDPSALTDASTANVPAPPPPPTTAPPPGAPAASAAGAPAAGAPAPAAAGGTTATTVAPGSPGALVTSGKVDLSGFAAVKNVGRATSPGTVPLPDPGFQPTLPFNTATTADGGEDGGADPGALASGQRALGSSESGGADRLRTLAFFAAGLLATVLLMHVLWVRSEVQREPLEALDPDDDFEADGHGPLDAGPTLDDTAAVDFAPVVVAANGQRKRRRPPARRPEVPTGV